VDESDRGAASETGLKMSSAAARLRDGADEIAGEASGSELPRSAISSSSAGDATTEANCGTPTMAKTGIAARGAIMSSAPRGPPAVPAIVIDLHV
jgi:hypothetical protein